jgi:hypothetical protein
VSWSTPHAPRLTPIDRDTARRILEWTLRYCLAYGSEMMDADTAARLAQELISVLLEPVDWWTNVTPMEPTTRHDLRTAESIRTKPFAEWRPVTDATFDAAIFGVTHDRVLLVCFADED